ncbi:hypothetical protein GCM10020229_19570 [Kitasatospora albolonga]|uniref:acyl carrier protein n=1 Tax=Kitasatospora albolonga TaxID=68173 RepID=UPI0031EC381E
MPTVSYDRLVDFIARKAEVPVEEIVPDEPLDTVGLDSLVLIEVALFVEREYGIELAEGELAATQTLNEWTAFLDGRTP